MVISLQDRKRQLVKDAIWEAATDLFAEKGYDETTIEEIVQAAGVSQRSFFRYFSSKSDLMAHSMESYGDVLTAAIEGCPRSYSLFEVLRETVLQVSEYTAAQPCTRKTMEIIAKYPAVRAAETSRLPEVQDRVVEAYARRLGKNSKDEVTPRLLAGLTLQVLFVILQSWFSHPERDIALSAREAFDKLSGLICGNNNRADRRPRQR